MYRVFNMGVGMIVVVDKSLVVDFQSAVPEPILVIGELAQGNQKVIFE